MVFSDSLHRFEEVGVERKLVAEIELDGLEESLVLRMFTQQRLRVGPVLTVHRVQLELLRLNKTNKQLNKHIHTQCDDSVCLCVLSKISI